MKTSQINLGDEVKEKVTGFTGVVVARTVWLTGCDRLLIQPKTNKDGSVPDARDFDEPLLTVLKKNKVKIDTKKEKEETGAGHPSFRINKK